MTVDASVPTSPPASGPLRFSRKAVAAIVIAGVVAVGVAFGVRWWIHPTVLQSPGYGFVAAPRPVANATLHIAITEPSAEVGSVTIRDVHVRSASDTARSVATVVACRFDGSLTLGTTNGSLDRYCTDVEPVAGDGDVELDAATEVLVLTLSPTRRGKTHVTGLRVDYATGRSHLWQRGEQSLALDFTVRAR